MAVNTSRGVFNDYTIKPKSLSEYTSFRGVTDFTQIGRFNQYETGYQFLSIIEMPKFMDRLAEDDAEFAKIHNSFRNMIEYEFRGLDGLPDMTADTYSITDGINEMRMINRVSLDTSVTVSSSYFEKQGSLLTKWSEYYLTGIKDRMTQARTYHGLIKNGQMEPDLANEVFTMLYYVTDSTMLRLERAVLLCNAQLTKADMSMYNGNRSDINNRETTIEWTCFPVYGTLVDKAAKSLLEDITNVEVGNPSMITDAAKRTKQKGAATENTAVLDSTAYRYGILDTAARDGESLSKIGNFDSTDVNTYWDNY